MDVSTPTPSAAVSPLRQRMLDDMRMRQFAEHTQDGYIRAVRKLATFLGRSPHTATAEDLRRFQLHLVDTGTGPVTINATITGLKFFFDITLGRPELMLKMTHVAVPRKLPVILSPEEVGRLIAAAPNLKHQAAMSVAYGAGLRVSEVVSLKVGDIDVAAYAAPAGLAGQETSILASLVDGLNESFAAWGARFTIDAPTQGTYSTIYLGGDGAWASAWGNYLGLAVESVSRLLTNFKKTGVIEVNLHPPQQYLLFVYCAPLSPSLAYVAFFSPSVIAAHSCSLSPITMTTLEDGGVDD